MCLQRSRNVDQYPTLKTFVLYLSIFILSDVTLPLAAGADVEVYFSPHGGATNAIVGEINRAHREILVQA